MTKDIDFVHLNLEPLAISVIQSAKEWMKSFGTLLNDTAKGNLFDLKAELEVGNILVFVVVVLLLSFMLLLPLFFRPLFLINFSSISGFVMG